MPNSSPTAWKPSGARELGKGCDSPPVFGPKVTSPAVGAYVDDAFCSESSFFGKSGFWASKRLFSLLGLNTSGRMDQIPSASMHLLGAEVALLKHALRTRETDEGARKLRIHVAQALHTNYLTPDAASKLRGRLGFYTSLLWGRLRRGMMGPSPRRQYGPRAHLLTPDLKSDLLRRYDAIGALPPR